MRLNLREVTGLVLIAAALIMIPTAWAFSRTLTVVASVLFVVGVALFLTERIRKREEKLAQESSGSGGYCGSPMPTDIHNYSGWRSGGRRADDNDGGDDD